MSGRISDALLDAADRLDKWRWVPRPPGFDEACAVTALCYEIGPWAYAERSIGVQSLARWNDLQVSAEDVKHALRLAALEAASEGK